MVPKEWNTSLKCRAHEAALCTTTTAILALTLINGILTIAILASLTIVCITVIVISANA